MANGRDRRQLVGAALRAARRAKKLTQEQVAAQVGCSVETLSNAERGASLPGLELFLKLAATLEIDLVALVDVPSRRRPASRARLALEAEAQQLARALTDDKLRLWLGTGRVLEKG